MSDSNGPVRRRRIAGETTPGAPVKKAPANKTPTVKKPTAKKDSAKKVSAKKVSAKKVKPTPKPEVTLRKAPAPARSRPAPAPPTVARKQATPVAPAPVSSTSTPTTSTPTTRSKPSRRDVLWLVPATLVAIAALVGGIFLVINPPSGSGGESDASRRQASAAAAGAAETIFSFKYDALDEHLKASKALMTPAFATEFDKIAPALTQLAPQRQIVVEAVARDAATLPCGDECSSSRANVLVFLDQARLISGTTQPTVFANRIKVSMTKTDDGWRVADIRAL